MHSSGWMSSEGFSAPQQHPIGSLGPHRAPSVSAARAHGHLCVPYPAPGYLTTCPACSGHAIRHAVDRHLPLWWPVIRFLQYVLCNRWDGMTLPERASQETPSQLPHHHRAVVTTAP